MSKSDSTKARDALLAKVQPLYDGVVNKTTQAAFGVALTSRYGPTYGDNKAHLSINNIGLSNERAEEIEQGNAQWNNDTAWFDGQDRPADALSPADFAALLAQAGYLTPTPKPRKK